MPVDDDIRAIDVEFLNRPDPLEYASAPKERCKVAIAGAADAMTDATFLAAGNRVREVPIRIDDLLPHEPPVRCGPSTHRFAENIASMRSASSSVNSPFKERWPITKLSASTNGPGAERGSGSFAGDQENVEPSAAAADGEVASAGSWERGAGAVPRSAVIGSGTEAAANVSGAADCPAPEARTSGSAARRSATAAFRRGAFFLGVGLGPSGDDGGTAVSEPACGSTSRVKAVGRGTAASITQSAISAGGNEGWSSQPLASPM